MVPQILSGNGKMKMGAWQKFGRAWKRSSFQLGVALSPKRRAAIPAKIFFVHVPKCAGSSLNGYLKTYLGSATSGASVFFNDIFTAQESLPIGHKKIEAAKTARVVSGHYSWAVVDKINPADGAFMATVLRDPVSRLMSLYNYTTGMPAGRLKTQIDGLHGMDADDFFTSEDPRIRHALDNYVTRQFAGRFDIMGDEVAELVTPAATRVCALDFVGFVEKFDEDFPQLAGQLGLPLPKAAPKVNLSRPLLDDAGRTATAFDRLSKPAQNAIQRYVQFDQVIYDQARARARLKS
jgi:hypothetical protein